MYISIPNMTRKPSVGGRWENLESMGCYRAIPALLYLELRNISGCARVRVWLED
jgi:hypothetical protein